MAEKIYRGPYGSYKAGSAGAVLNALAEQENRPTTWIDNLVIGHGKLMKRSNEAIVVATFEWKDDEVTFIFLNTGY